MITITINTEKYAYDVHSLIKAFFPKADINMDIIQAHESENKTIVEIISPDMEPDGINIQIQGNTSDTKNILKRRLYRELSQLTGQNLPWGALTGIRPVRLALSMLEKGMTEDEVASFMRDNYLTSDKKINLSIDIAKRESAVLKTLDYSNSRSIYIGIPFCPSICKYCSFSSNPISAWQGKTDTYLNALEREITYVTNELKDKTTSTLYIGGGTPTSLSEYELERLLAFIAENLGKDFAEYTLEAGRPDSITAEKLRTAKRYGVNRISINPQTMNEDTLKRIGRAHTESEVTAAFNMARDEGFYNINMDIIIGLQGETEADVSDTLRKIKVLSPDSLTVHTLAVKRASRLKREIDESNLDKANCESAVCDAQAVDITRMMQIAEQGAHSMKMNPYYLYRQKNTEGNLENVGYAKEGCYGLYNILMMEEKQDIIALGAGAVSKVIKPDGRIERCDNVKEVSAYIDRIEEMINRKKKMF